MIQTLIDFLRSLTDPEKLIHLLGTLLSGWYGYAAFFAIVYSETGLLLGFFLPGDSLLFTVGVVAGAGHLDIVLVNVLLMTAAILGDSTAFVLGRQTGPKIFSRADSTFFKQESGPRSSAAPTPRFSSRSTSPAPTPSTRSTAARPSCMRGSCPSCAPLPPSSRAWARCRT